MNLNRNLFGDFILLNLLLVKDLHNIADLLLSFCGSGVFSVEGW